MAIKWEEPPELPKAKWQDEADELRANPEMWGIVVTVKTRSDASTLASTIKKGTLKAFHLPGAFQAVARKLEDGSGANVYARYIGERT